jgi:hypothetical protein
VVKMTPSRLRVNIPDFVIDPVCFVLLQFLNKPCFLRNRREINPFWLRNGTKTRETICKSVLTVEKLYALSPSTIAQRFSAGKHVGKANRVPSGTAEHFICPCIRFTKNIIRPYRVLLCFTVCCPPTCPPEPLRRREPWRRWMAGGGKGEGFVPLHSALRNPHSEFRIVRFIMLLFVRRTNTGCAASSALHRHQRL